MTGFDAFSIAASTSRRFGDLSGLPNSLISAPAMKVLPSHMSTMACTAESATARFTLSTMPSRTACEIAFTGGEFTAMTAMFSSTMRVVTELTAAIRISCVRALSTSTDEGSSTAVRDRTLREQLIISGQSLACGEGFASQIAAVYIRLARANVRRPTAVPQRGEACSADRLFEAWMVAQEIGIRKPQHAKRSVRLFSRKTCETIEYELRLLQRRAAKDLGRSVDVSVVCRERDGFERFGY